MSKCYQQSKLNPRETYCTHSSFSHLLQLTGSSVSEPKAHIVLTVLGTIGLFIAHADVLLNNKDNIFRVGDYNINILNHEQHLETGNFLNMIFQN